ANQYNLQEENGFLKYRTICQRRDFYLWFDQERKKQGHEIKWIGIASIATGQLSKLEDGFIRIFIVRNREIINFSQIGSEKVFAFAYPKLKDLYNSETPVVGLEAEIWDQKYELKEQTEILEPLYKNLSEKALQKLEKMAKGKGVFYFGVPSELRFVGNIADSHNRYVHGINKLLPQYLKNNKETEVNDLVELKTN
ncbi:MAG: hypothetical protein OEM04_05525, partial [Flavobacteriaceae bacterium]|nr:hypothetical protein [Flavobacteriaceae bacterium]